jgi:transcriptional regulator with XRE-family HTH domain
MTTTNAKKLAAAIKRHRKAQKLSQYTLAQRAGVPDSTIYRLERGEFKLPKPDTIQRIARALDVEFEDLFELAGYDAPGLPEVPVYLRRKLDLSDEAADKVERYIERIKKQEGGDDAKRGR